MSAPPITVTWDDFDRAASLGQQRVSVSWRSLALAVYQRLAPTLSPPGSTIEEQEATFARVRGAAETWLKTNADQLVCTELSYFVPGHGQPPARYRRRRGIPPVVAPRNCEDT